MRTKHVFIFQPGKWVGEGTVGFNSSNEKLFFTTHWQINISLGDDISLDQEVEMEGVEEKVCNHFQLSEITSSSFVIQLSNDIVGSVQGTGIIDEKTVAWEFRGQSEFQGYEMYELQGDGAYRLHAEYSSTDQFRTTIDGRIRKVN